MTEAGRRVPPRHRASRVAAWVAGIALLIAAPSAAVLAAELPPWPKFLLACLIAVPLITALLSYDRDQW